MVKHWFRVAAAASLMAAVIFGAGTSGAAADGATVTIHKAECRSNFGADIFEECHDERVAEVRFILGDGDYEYVASTDADGELSFDGFAVGAIAIVESAVSDVAMDDTDYVGAFVYCRDLVSDEVLVEGMADDLWLVELTVEDGMDVVCDWYNLTGEAPAPTATPAPTQAPQPTEVPASETVTELPSTGTGSIDGGNVAMLLLAMVVAAAGFGAVALRRRTA